MTLLKWTPFFDIKEESPIVPIWIFFLNLSLHFFNPHVLHALGSIFGRPLQTNQATATRSRPSVARILVEFYITKKHTKEVWLRQENAGYMQKVEFENIPIFCLHCKVQGHSINECYVVHPNLKKGNKEVKEVSPSIMKELNDFNGIIQLHISNSNVVIGDLRESLLVDNPIFVQEANLMNSTIN